MKHRLAWTIVIATLLAAAVGCSKQPTRVDAFSGTAYELAKVSQLNNPDAGVHTGPALGLDGAVAAKVVDRYEKGFEKPAPKTSSFTVNVGGSGLEKQ